MILDEGRIFVIDGQIWTSADMTVGVDLALAMVEKDLGLEEAVRLVARKLVLDQRHGGSQSQFSALLELDVKSDRVQTALAYARENLTTASPLKCWPMWHDSARVSSVGCSQKERASRRAKRSSAYAWRQHL